MTTLFFSVLAALCMTGVTSGLKMSDIVGHHKRGAYNMTPSYHGDCAPGGPIPMCNTPTACENAVCEENRNATCMINICGDCKQIWFDDWNEIVKSCSG